MDKDFENKINEAITKTTAYTKFYISFGILIIAYGVGGTCGGFIIIFL